MNRVFTQDVGKYRAGDIRDYPLATWRDIAKSAKKPLEKITETTDNAAKVFAAPKKK
jgi:hypothetical protein